MLNDDFSWEEQTSVLSNFSKLHWKNLKKLWPNFSSLQSPAKDNEHGEVPFGLFLWSICLERQYPPQKFRLNCDEGLTFLRFRFLK